LRSRTLFTALNNVRYDLAALGPVGRRLERTTSGPWTGAAEISAKIGHKAASVTLGNEALHETGAVQRAGQASEHLGFHALLGPGLCRPQVVGLALQTRGARKLGRAPERTHNVAAICSATAR